MMNDELRINGKRLCLSQQLEKGGDGLGAVAVLIFLRFAELRESLAEAREEKDRVIAEAKCSLRLSGDYSRTQPLRFVKQNALLRQRQITDEARLASAYAARKLLEKFLYAV